MNVNRSFKRKVIELMAGSASAQILSVLTIPILSRLYDPESFGIFALYYTTSAMIGTLANFRYDLAIVIADTEAEGKKLLSLCLYLSLLFGVLTTLAGFSLTLIIPSPELSASNILLTGLSVVACGYIPALGAWVSRDQKFQVLGLRNLIERGLVVAIGIALGLLGAHATGLILANLLGLIFSLFYLSRHAPWVFDPPKILFHTFKQYSRFPRNSLPSTALSTGSPLLLSFFMKTHFSTALLGQFSLANRLLDGPVVLVGHAFGMVYLQHITKTDISHRKTMFLKSLSTLGLVTAPAVIVFAFVAPQLFELVFGKEWYDSGIIARWLAIATFFRLLYMAHGPILIAAGKNSIEFFISALTLIMFCLAFLASVMLHLNLEWTTISVSLCSSIASLTGLLMVYQVLNKESR